ncbi:MAG: hypothetical protein ACYC8S_02190 [Minisyncoccota bacterium]
MFHFSRSSIFRNSTISVLILGMLVFFIPPRPAEAIIFVPTNDLVLNIQKNTDLVKVYGLDGLAYLAAQAVLDQLNTSITNWIKGGNNGNPLYITDLHGYLNNIGYKVEQDYLDQVNSSPTCYSNGAPPNARPWVNPDTGQEVQPGGSTGAKPWINPDTGQPQPSVYDTGAIFGTSGSYSSTPTCPFADGKQFQSISNNGWSGFLSQMIDPGASPVAAMITGQEEIAYRTQVRQQEALQKAIWNKGYLSQEDCSSGTCVTKTPGSLLESQISFSLQSGTRRIELADKINEMVMAVMTNAVDNLANKGVGLFNDAILNALPGGVSSAINRATGGNPSKAIINGIDKLQQNATAQPTTNPYQNTSNTNSNSTQSPAPQPQVAPTPNMTST